MPAARAFAVANQKGGVGKTTTCVNLAASMAATGQRLLLVDFDPQGNATMGSGIDKSQLEWNAYDVLMGGCGAEQAILRSPTGGFDVLPANQDLTAAEAKLHGVERRQHRLRQCLEPVRARYDYVLIDCPPALSMLTINALIAADAAIVPVQCEYYALEGLASLEETIHKLRRMHGALHIAGVLRTMYDKRVGLAQDVSDELLMRFGDKVYKTMIPRNVRLAEAPSHGRPVMQYDRKSKGAIAYLTLAGEILRRGDAAAKAPAPVV